MSNDVYFDRFFFSTININKLKKLMHAQPRKEDQTKQTVIREEELKRMEEEDEWRRESGFEPLTVYNHVSASTSTSTSTSRANINQADTNAAITDGSTPVYVAAQNVRIRILPYLSCFHIYLNIIYVQCSKVKYSIV